jgi:predicted RNA-binding Zn ribbon-like protein
MPATPRPHVGEPLALDLLNTVWMAGGEPVDYLADADNVRRWLDDNGFDTPASTAVHESLVEARTAILALLIDADATAAAAVNEVLSHAHVRVSLDRQGGVTHTVDCGDPARRPAALAAMNLVELLEQAPTRVRRCEHPGCVLWFLDTSRNGTRRWHSMTTCGNREKARRHYARARDQAEG